MVKGNGNIDAILDGIEKTMGKTPQYPTDECFVGPEATEYVRELDDAQLVGMTVHIQQRIEALLGQGVPLPMQQIENHHLIGLLECFVGPEESLRVREWHVMWVDRQLDRVEAAIRMQMLGTLNGDGMK